MSLINKYKRWVPTLSVIMSFALFLGACQAIPSTSPASLNQPPTISVEGTGQVSLDPSLARISIGVQTEGENAQETVGRNNENVERLMTVLEEFGIPEQDIQTSEFSIRQQEKREPVEETGSEVQGTYVVSNIVRITLRNLDQLGALLDEVVKAGANSIHNIQFDTDEKEDANKRALELAMKDARARAEAIAETAGVELGDVYRVETFGGGPVFAGGQFEEAEAEAAAVPISQGQLDIQVRVNVSYQIAR